MSKSKQAKKKLGCARPSCPRCGNSNTRKDGTKVKGKIITQFWECCDNECRRKFKEGNFQRESVKAHVISMFPFLMPNESRQGRARGNQPTLTLTGLARRAKLSRQTIIRWYTEWKINERPTCHHYKYLWLTFFEIIVNMSIHSSIFIKLLPMVGELMAYLYEVDESKIYRHGYNEDWNIEGFKVYSPDPAQDKEFKPVSSYSDRPTYSWPSEAQRSIAKVSNRMSPF